MSLSIFVYLRRIAFICVSNSDFQENMSRFESALNSVSSEESYLISFWRSLRAISVESWRSDSKYQCLQMRYFEYLADLSSLKRRVFVNSTASAHWRFKSRCLYCFISLLSIHIPLSSVIVDTVFSIPIDSSACIIILIIDSRLSPFRNNYSSSTDDNSLSNILPILSLIGII